MGFINKLFSKNSKAQHEVATIQQKQPAKIEFNDIKELLLNGVYTEKESELKRKEAYVERHTQKILLNLLETKTDIAPTYDTSYGFRYASIESILNENNPQEAESLLERLYNLDILEKTFFDTVSVCPDCGSTSITLHYSCQKCSSHHIVKTSLTEHIPCGNIDEREKYIKTNSVPTCPKCGEKLVEGQYRDMGRWYVCKECKEKFEHPNLDLVCRKCSTEFTTQKSIIHELSKYSLNLKREQEIRQNVTSLECITELLIGLGFTIEMPASVIGEKSGIQHYFTLIAKKQLEESEIIITIDHAVGDTEVSASQLILYAYKISEVKVDLPIFVAIPRLSETAKKIAQGYNVLVIEGIPKDSKQIATLHDEIEKRLPEVERIIKELIIRRGKEVNVWRNAEGKFVKISQSSEKKHGEK